MGRYEEEQEVDLLEFAKEMVVRWKLLLVLAVVCALLVGVLVPTYQSYQDVKQAELEKVVQTEEELEASLTEDELEVVDTAVNYEAQLADLEEYYNNSYYMHLDGNNVNKLLMIYYLESSDASYTEVLLAAYRNYIENEDFLEAIEGCYPDLDVDNKTSYVRELVSCTRNGDDDQQYIDVEIQGKKALIYNFILPDGVDATALAEAVDTALTAYGSELSESVCANTMTMATQYTTTVISTGITSAQKSKYDEIVSLETSISNLSLSDTQEELVALRLASDASTTEESQVADTTEVAESDAGISFSAKYAVLGFALGIFLSMVCYFVMLILKNAMGRTDEMFGVRRIAVYADGRTDERFVSRKLYQKFFAKGSMEELLQTATTSILRKLEANEQRELSICYASNLKEEEIQIAETLKEKIEKQGIEAQAWTADGMETITDVVVFVYNEKTKRSELAETLQICDSFGQDMLGMIEINK